MLWKHEQNFNKKSKHFHLIHIFALIGKTLLITRTLHKNSLSSKQYTSNNQTSIMLTA